MSGVSLALLVGGCSAAAAELEDDLRELDEAYADALGACAGATLVTSHETFGYLADRSGLEQVGISKGSPASCKKYMSFCDSISDGSAKARSVYPPSKATSAARPGVIDGTRSLVGMATASGAPSGG